MLRNGMLFAVAALLCFPAAHAQTAVSANTIPKDQLIQPEQLHRELQAHPRDLLILQVGSHVLFEESHIPGSEYAGRGSRPAGLDALRARVTSLPRGRSIVIYCGCCPWDKCPNIAPAWQLLHQMGFTHVRALYIANNFGADWVARGYPAEKSQ
ncbi:MAG TPA: rhodanese-like domain-containing protein [Acidobacteriaceae bacterium]|nr:rhodanese-like domain-containing protein [Acidobacteriaceae bacterium]